MDKVQRMIEVRRKIAEVQELCQRRHGDRLPKFDAQVKALSEIAARRYGAKHG